MRSIFLASAVYLAFLVYPTLSVKIVQALACHEIEGVMYHSEDYSLKCSGTQYDLMRVYTVIWIVMFVIGFPAMVLLALMKYRRVFLKTKTFDSRKFSLGFLTDDYKQDSLSMLWEWMEMVRKLSLSLIGVLFPDKGPTSIACALILSVLFWVLHAQYQPFRYNSCNIYQYACMATLTCLYFCGLLLKVDAVTASERNFMGRLMITMLVLVILGLMWGIYCQLRLFSKELRALYHKFGIKFEGRILHKPGASCIVSFPGKYEEGWKAVVHAGRASAMSVAW
jgi:hypothetical protein